MSTSVKIQERLIFDIRRQPCHYSIGASSFILTVTRKCIYISALVFPRGACLGHPSGSARARLLDGLKSLISGSFQGRIFVVHDLYFHPQTNQIASRTCATTLASVKSALDRSSLRSSRLPLQIVSQVVFILL
jgi:hypothetical protein